jgi:hypothetical protein
MHILWNLLDRRIGFQVFCWTVGPIYSKYRKGNSTLFLPRGELVANLLDDIQHQSSILKIKLSDRYHYF